MFRQSLIVATILAVPAMSATTFYKDALPILQSHCQECHRPGEAAPFSLMTYQEARPWAKAIRAAVATKKMPPWFANPAHGKFSNDRSLSASQLATLQGLYHERLVDLCQSAWTCVYGDEGSHRPAHRGPGHGHRWICRQCPKFLTGFAFGNSTHQRHVR